jgi:hypothetical protein
MSLAQARTDLGSVRTGHYARREVLISRQRSAESAIELVLPFGALFSALFPDTPFVVRRLSFDYVGPVELDADATFSVKVGDLGEEGGAVQLSLLVFRGSLVCVRGSATLEFGEVTHG